MKYYFRVGRKTTIAIVFTLLFIAYMVYHVFFLGKGNSYFRYLAEGYILFLIVFPVSKNYNFIRLVLKHRPIIEVNEQYIFDCAANMKYYWSDIKEVVEEGRILYVTVINADKYLSLFKNRFSRYWHYSKLEKHFKVNVDCVNINRDALLETLTDFSVRSQETK